MLQQRQVRKMQLEDHLRYDTVYQDGNGRRCQVHVWPDDQIRSDADAISALEAKLLARGVDPAICSAPPQLNRCFAAAWTD